MGVKFVPPMPPRLEMVKLPPSSSSGPMRLARARWPRARPARRRAARCPSVRVADHRHQQAALGVHGHADVDVLLVDQLARRRVEAGVEVREALQGLGRRPCSRIAVMVSLRRRPRRAWRSTCRGSASSSVMSAWSYWVTWGIVVQAWVMLRAVISRTWLQRLAPTAPQRAKSGRGAAADRCRRRGARARRSMARLTCSCTSSTEMRPPGPVPATRSMSTPSSRARRRTEGEAGAVSARPARRRVGRRRSSPRRRGCRRRARRSGLGLSGCGRGFRLCRRRRLSPAPRARLRGFGARRLALGLPTDRRWRRRTFTVVALAPP